MSGPTPETDAEAWIETDRANAVVFAKFARKLERERDEANEELHKQLVRYDQLFDEAEKIRIERDEARELLRILVGLVAYGLGQSGEEWSLDAMRQATSAIQNAKSLEESK